MGVGKVFGWLAVLGILGAGGKIGYDLYNINKTLGSETAYNESLKEYWYGSAYKKKLIEIFLPDLARAAKKRAFELAAKRSGIIVERKLQVDEYIATGGTLEEKVDYIDEMLERGEITPEQAQQMVVDLYGPVIGKERAQRIMDIATNPDYSPREVSEKIVDEVPTGLIAPLDKFAKGVAKYYGRKATEDY